MVWLASDLDVMSRLINSDVAETLRMQIEGGTEAALETESSDLKEGVA
jgi:hypothetical protein